MSSLPSPSSRLDPYALAGATLRERYSIDSFVGHGRFSVVYQGTELATEKAVALRFVKARGTLTSSQRTMLVERLRAVLQPVIELAEHAPTFADVLDVTALAKSDGLWMPVVVHTWAAGQTLESMLASERQRGDAPRSIGRAVDLLSPVADAVQYGHSQGIVHGGLSPRTVFVRDRTGVVVTDLGLSRALAILQAEDRAFSEVPTRLPTFAAAYGAPEQFAGNRAAIGPATDVFALALLVVELVTGTSPLGDGDDEQLERAALDPAIRPTSRHGGTAIGSYVRSVLDRALAVRPEDRYASVTSFWDALRTASRVLLRGRAVRVVPPPLPTDSPAAAAPRSARAASLTAMATVSQSDAPPRAVGPRTLPPPRANIPPNEFFAPSEAGATMDGEVASVTNPLFGGIPSAPWDRARSSA